MWHKHKQVNTYKEQEEKTAYRIDDIYLIINDKKSSKNQSFILQSII